MSDSERLGAALVLALFLHFALALFHPKKADAPPRFHVLIEQEESSLARRASTPGLGIEQASAQSEAENEQRDKKRQAYLQYLEDVDAAIHARRLSQGENGLIGIALCAFTIAPDGSFSEPQLVSSSGTVELDQSALRAIRAASGVVRRPAIIGEDPIRLSLAVKYQYGLE